MCHVLVQRQIQLCVYPVLMAPSQMSTHSLTDVRSVSHANMVRLTVCIKCLI